MSAGSKIEWTEATWNPIAGCSLVSPGCTHCYAMRTAARLASMGQAKYAGTTKQVNGRPVWTGLINFDHAALEIPLKTKKPTTYFVNSMSDLFHEAVSFEFIDVVFAVMALTPQHTFQVLTKRPERMREYLMWTHPTQKSRDADRVDRWSKEMAKLDGKPARPRMVFNPLPNVWLGTSCEDQTRADERIPELLKCPAAVRFVSLEPLLGPIDLNKRELLCSTWRRGATIGIYLDWVIVGGESGPGARPCNIAWIREIVQQCAATGTACFVKQLGKYPVGHVAVSDDQEIRHPKGGDINEWPHDLQVRQMPVVH